MRRLFVLSSLLFAATSVFGGTGRIVIVNVDTPGIGFNDPTPAEPVGGNPGITIGQQRLNVFEKAADRWRTLLDTNVDIRVRASFAALECTGTNAVLGQAFTAWEVNFDGAPKANVYYPAALANKLAGRDVSPATDDMSLQFNSAIDSPDCLGDTSWYYGFDGNEGDDNELYAVVLHEIGHGLGSASRALSEFTGNRPSIYDTHAFDLTAGLRWDQMTPEQRRVSLTNTGNVVWDGENVRAKSPQFLSRKPTLTVTAPAAVARDYSLGTATFGPDPSVASVSGNVVAALDAADDEGPLTTDACSAFTNADALRGAIALVDRGTCTFLSKARRAQEAGATALLVVNNREDCMPASMGATEDASDITIPVISVGIADGARIREQASVSAMLRVDPTRRAGGSSEGYVHLYVPCTVEGGSSLSHWDTLASPNLLMEPSINRDLMDGVDLTIYLLYDIGWTAPPRTGRRFLKR
jgi:hypothetical protein